MTAQVTASALQLHREVIGIFDEKSKTFVALDFSRRMVLIGGTAYAGEIKKSIFTVMNFLLPQRGVMTMHCSANVGAGGDVGGARAKAGERGLQEPVA